MEVGAAAAAAAGVHLAGYNRDNFFQNLHLSQARRFQKQQIVTSQADLFRADVEQAIGASTAVQDRLIVVSALLLGVSAHTFGFHISEHTTEFLNVLFYLTTSVSFLYFMLALFASICANVLARTCQKELLNHCVRPPFEDMMKAIDDAAANFSAENFERQGLSTLFRVPGVQRFTERKPTERKGTGKSQAPPAADTFLSSDNSDIENSDSLEKLISQQVSNEHLLLEMKEEWDELATYTPYFLVWGLRNLLTSFGFFLLSHFYLDWKPYAFLGHLFYVILTLGLSVLCERLMATSRAIFTMESLLYLTGQALSWYIVYRERDAMTADQSNETSILVVYLSQLANAVFAYLRFVWNATDALRSIMSRTDGGASAVSASFERASTNLSIDSAVPNHDRLSLRWQQLSRVRRAARRLCQFGIGAVIAVWMCVVVYQAMPAWTAGAEPPQMRALAAVEVNAPKTSDALAAASSELVTVAVEMHGRQERLRHLGARKLGEVLRTAGFAPTWREWLQGKRLAVFDPNGREISSELPLAQVGAEELHVVAEAPMRL
ncbi:unnamed protein product [Symbiodinium natans]|uniref:Uncharacterized protein n=1 Tax=Symbiodinium natans TaxID=878477 RepID=A0A812STZ3_9DINO|nr:unnamed protein product [Symbiodinium natans]